MDYIKNQDKVENLLARFFKIISAGNTEFAKAINVEESVQRCQKVLAKYSNSSFGEVVCGAINVKQSGKCMQCAKDKIASLNKELAMHLANQECCNDELTKQYKIFKDIMFAELMDKFNSGNYENLILTIGPNIIDGISQAGLEKSGYKMPELDQIHTLVLDFKTWEISYNHDIKTKAA